MSINSLLENGLLSAEVKASILEAWEGQCSEIREQVAAELREEFAKKYEYDRKQIVESMNDMMTDVLNEAKSEADKELNRIRDQRTKKAKIMESFVKQAKSILSEMAKTQNEENRAAKKALKEFQTFAIKSLDSDVKELRNETRKLAESRVRVLEEGRVQIREAKEQFYKTATKNASKWIQESWKSEMSELKTQINEARQAKYGMKLFEAAMEDFRTYFFNENKEIRQLVESNKAREAEISNLKTIINEAKTEADSAQKKARLFEQRIQRQKKLDQALGHLPRDKRGLMEELLESVATDKLDGEIKKFLPMVLKEDVTPRRSLNEDRRSQKVVTGDRVERPRLVEQTEVDEVDEDLEQIIKLGTKF